MPRSSRAKSDSSQPKSPSTRKSIQLSPRQSTKLENYRGEQIRSPTSPTTRRAPRKLLTDETLPSTPEEWVEFAKAKLRQAAVTLNVVDIIMQLAEIESDLLEFLMTADVEIRDMILEALCGSAFPTTRGMWRESINHTLLQRFQTYFNRLPPDLVDRRLDEEGRRLVSITTALDALDHLGFEMASTLEQVDEQVDPKAKGKSQKKRKASLSIANRVRRSTTTVDPRVFKAVNVDFPGSLGEAQDIELTLMLRLREAFEVFLVSFANPELATHAKSLLFMQSLGGFMPAAQASAALSQVPTDNSLTSAADPGIFPAIRPLTAAKYFDDGPALGAWPVVVAGRAVSDLRQMQKGDRHVFDMVQKKITELSQGFFSESNQKRLIGLGTEVPIYEAKVSRDLRIVYQVDIDSDLNEKVDKQIIRLYGIYTHAQLDNRVWSLISRQIQRRGPEYRRRCLYRVTHRAPGQNVTLPAVFSHEEELEVPESTSSTEAQDGVTDEEYLHLHSIIALEKYLSMSQSLVQAILNDSDASHLFHPSPKEREIISYGSACFVLGRSGTGKTTSIVFKILGLESLFANMADTTKPRQVFVTQSRLLAQRVQEYYQKLITSSSESLGGVKKPAQDEEQILADLDDEDATAFGLPPKYSMLEDHHFPLFLSFDQLCSLLEADYGLQFGRSLGTKTRAAEKQFNAFRQADRAMELNFEDEDNQPYTTVFTSPALATLRSDRERAAEAKQAVVDFDVFLVAFWPHFDQRLTKGLDSALVYSEFLGIIEGSEAALGTEAGALSREDYIAGNGNSRRSSFASERDRIYDLYKAYRKRRGQLGSYDAAERTHALVSATNQKIPGPKIDCLYVDEAQDNLLIDIKLLRNLSSNPHGIFMAGDTAQTISAGSSFRFEDLKAFMWRLEEKDEAVRRRKRNAIHPVLFHLAVNYRSHGGIVDCASSVVQLISQLFPDSIDKLKKETGLVEGPKPVMFSGWEPGSVQFEQFLRGGGNDSIDFGAEQVILVRNDAARDALRSELGEIGLILTLYESKGLEFDDVLLFNFFEDSVSSAATWRVVLRGLSAPGHGPLFDEVRHAVICSELKHLYVGLTRARNHCWIWDVSEKADPMRMFWTEQNLVAHCKPGSSIPKLGRGASSSKADWARTGRALFNKRLYSEAARCFQRAQMLLERDIATAYEARKQARLFQAAQSVQTTQYFHDAAELFMRCALGSTNKQQTSCYLRAAECFSQAQEWKSSAEAFTLAGEFDLAAKTFRRGGYFDEAVRTVKNYRDRMQEAVADEVIEVAKLEYLRTEQYEQAGELFSDDEEQLEYMADYGFDTAQIHFLEDQKRYDQAAQVAFREHDILEGIRLLLCSDDSTLILQAADRAFRALWAVLPFGPSANKVENDAITSLIKQLGCDKLQVLGKYQTYQLEVFKAIRAKDFDRVLSLAQPQGIPAQNQKDRSTLSLLCFSYGSHLLVPPSNSTIPDFISKSRSILDYLSELQHFARHFDLACSRAQRLLGFEPVEPNIETESGGNQSNPPSFWIHSTSLMFEGAQSSQSSTNLVSSTLGISALSSSEPDTRRLTIQSIYNVLKSEIQTIHNAVNHREARYLHSCLEFALFGRCQYRYCGRQEVSSFKLAAEQRQILFNQRARALIIQVQIIHLYQAQTHSEESERRRFKRTWARKMYELSMPVFPPLGSAVCIERARIPELIRGSDVLSAWCEEALHYLDPRYGDPTKFLSDVLAYMDLAFRVKGATFAGYAPYLLSRRLVKWRDDLMLHTPVPGQRYMRHHSVVLDFINFYVRQSQDVLQRVLRATHHVVTNCLAIEANVLVNLLEFIGRELIVEFRRWSRGPKGVFDGLLVPQSWALDLVRRPPLWPQIGVGLRDYMKTLYRTIELLHVHNPRVSRFYSFSGQLTLTIRSVLITRICRLLILIASNFGFQHPAREEVRQSIAQSLAGPGEMDPVIYTRLAGASSWAALSDTIMFNPGILNRGADEFVFLSARTGSAPPPINPGARSISYASIPELEQLLSLHVPTKQSGTILNPGARTFAPTNNADQSSTTHEPGDSLGARGTRTSASSHVDYLASMQETDISRTLTAEEIKMGKKILFCYRKHAFRRRVNMRWAVPIIWAHYSRYRLRKAPQTATGERIRKLHSDYTLDLKRLIYPALLVKPFYHHKRILLGHMPHVIIYLRGLEEVNRRERDAKRKELLTAGHEDLELLQSRMDGCRAFAKQIKALIQDLSPGSSLLTHLDTLKQRLKGAVDARRTIAQEFKKDAIPTDLEHHYERGVLAILAPRASTQRKARKPALNNSDLGDLF